jgi:beta-lactamase regulating signal transducer with metallopeptidase domain
MSDDTTQIIGWSLIHFFWQGAVIALLLQGCLVGCRTAAGRYRWLMGALMLMIAAPLATAWLLSRPEVLLPPVQAALLPTGLAASKVAAPAASTGLHFSVSWLVYAWLAGVIALSARWLGGWVWLERVRRGAEPLSGDLSLRCRSLIRHVGVSKSVQFAQSAFLAVPMVVGWLRPVVLIPLSTLTTLSPQQLDSVILHELAHIRRLDAFANLFQILVETLLFYHPAVWWVSHRIRVERENCCDDIAVGIAGDNFGYAMALTLLEAERAFPTMAMAATGGALKNRVKRLLGQEQVPNRPFHLAALAVAVIGLMLGGGALKAMASPTHVSAPAVVMAPVEPPEPAVEGPSVSVVTSGESASIAMPSAPIAPPAPPPPAKPAAASYIDGLASSGYANLSSSELIALKSVGVTAEEAAEWRKTGFSMSASQMVSLHSAGVRPEDAAGFAKAGMPIKANDLAALKSVGVTADYVRQMRLAGFDTDRVSDFMTARSVGVTPDFVAMLKHQGVTDLTPSRIVTLKAAGFN